MKKKRLAAALSLVLAGAACTALVGCDWFDLPAADGTANPYEVATELGYTGSEGQWLSERGQQSSQARLMYEEAKADGYTGSYLDFLSDYALSVPDGTASVNSALRSAVSVRSISTHKNGYSTKDYASGGAGVIYSCDRAAGNAYIITNYHVVYDKDSTGTESVPHISDRISVYLYGGEGESGEISATYVGGAMDYDIAVLAVSGSTVLKESAAQAVTAADSDMLTVGERAYAIGNPEGDGISVTEGVVSVDAEYIDILSSDEKRMLSLLEIRTDAAVNHGNSGGGLFNANGELIGIVNAKAETDDNGGRIDDFGYAIPANLALSVARNIIDNAPSGCKGAQRAMLGITTSAQQGKGVYYEPEQKYYKTESVVVQSVSAGKAASGKLQQGDVLCAVKITDGSGNVVAQKSVTRGFQVSNLMFNVRKGFTVEFTVSRAGKTVAVEVPFDNNNYFELYS